MTIAIDDHAVGSPCIADGNGMVLLRIQAELRVGEIESVLFDGLLGGHIERRYR
jgi:hypothetical protein